MKSLDRLANIAFIVTCAILIAWIGRNALTARSPGPGTSAAVTEFLATGTTSPLSIQSVTSEPSGTAVIAFVSSTCRFCASQMDFYRDLDKTASDSTFGFYFASPEPIQVLRAYLEKNGIRPDRGVEAKLGPGLRGTPTLLVVDRDSRVKHSWQGALNADQQRVVKTMLQ